jgi:hypothetical protein
MAVTFAQIQQAIRGEPGPPGESAAWRVKAGAPVAEDGQDGDMLLDTLTGDVWGPKAAGVWPAGAAYNIAEGRQGEQGPAGPEGPQGAAGQDGSGIVVRGTLTYAQIIAVVSPEQGDLYLQADDTAEGNPGDGWTWDGTQWLNVGPIRGPQGLQGLPGNDGQDGMGGVDGQDGASAYELAVAAGFVGDEAAWLLSLKGDPGSDGQDGAAGQNGADGADADLSQLMVVTAHGANNAVARPAVAGAVYWIGTVEPLNAIDGDLYSGTV